MEKESLKLKGPLMGIRVIECAMAQHGPVAGRLLADMGAEVIKVEPPAGDSARQFMQMHVGGARTVMPGGPNFYFEICNRNKKSIAIDLKKPEARDIIYGLAKKSNIFLTNYRKAAMQRLGLDYKSLSALNPKLIYASASAFGPKGPDANKPGFDFVAQARSGFVFLMGFPGMPPLFATGGLADQIGAMVLAYAIVLALFVQERYGIGQQISTSILGSLLMAESVNLASTLMLGAPTVRDDRKKAGNPLWNFYKCKDNKWLALAMMESDRYWANFVAAIGLPQLKEDKRFNNAQKRAENCEELISILDNIFALRKRDEWLKIFEQAGDFVVGPIQTMEEVIMDPQVVANEYIKEIDHFLFGRIRVPGVMIDFEKTPGQVGEAPKLGAHTREVLCGLLGYTDDELAKLKAKRVIFEPE